MKRPQSFIDGWHEARTRPSRSPSIFGMLTVLFVGLKLTGHIDWPWWQVTALWWGPLAVAMLAGLVLLILGIIGD